MDLKFNVDDFDEVFKRVLDVQSLIYLSDLILDVALSGEEKENILIIENSAIYLNKKMKYKIAEIRELLGKHEMLK